jgi:hypothetical protein
MRPWHQDGTKPVSGDSAAKRGLREVHEDAREWSGEPSGTRTRDPLINSDPEDLRTGTYDDASACDFTTPLRSVEPVHGHEPGRVGTNLKPGVRSGSQPPPARGPSGDAARRRITYIDIQAHVRAQYGFTPRTGWIAHVKELNGLSLRPTHNRGSSARAIPCPAERRPAIEEALRHFGLL